MAHHDVEFVAVHDEIALAVGRDVHRVAHDLDAAERQPDELARELVVIARHEDHARAVPDLAQQLLDDVVVLLRPVPARAQAPAVDDVADEKDRVGVVVTQEVEDQLPPGSRGFPDGCPRGRSCDSGVSLRGSWARGASGGS